MRIAKHTPESDLTAARTSGSVIPEWQEERDGKPHVTAILLPFSHDGDQLQIHGFLY